MSETMVLSLLQRIKGLKNRKEELRIEESMIQREINGFQKQIDDILEEVK